MKWLVAILFIIGSGFSFGQTLEHSVNSGYYTWQGGDMALDYVIGEPVGSVFGSSLSMTSVILATLADSTTGIHIANDIDFRMYPNPASTHIAFSIAQAGNWAVSLLDMAGSKVADLHSGWLEGNSEAIFSLADLPISSGNYFVLISNDSQNEILENVQSDIMRKLDKKYNILAKIIILK